METYLDKFILEIKNSLNKEIFNKLLLNKPVLSEEKLNNISIKLVKIKEVLMFSFILSYETKDITKNFILDDGLNIIKNYLIKDFKNAVLYTKEKDIRFSYNKKMQQKLEYSKKTIISNISLEHNKEKERIIKIENNVYLKELGIITNDDKIVKNMQSKYKQINKYIEIITPIIKELKISGKEEINVVDMGSGKGYLTFAVYDFLTNKLGLDSKLTGVEARSDLVDLCNEIAKKSKFENLNFVKGNISDYNIEKLDILIALHACDTATDDAIFKGIKSNSKVIIVSPCCHKQVRKDLDIPFELNSITKHGILEERLSEILTDTLRGLILEASGYKTQIFEYIADAHTHKNIMIVGVKKSFKNISNPLDEIKRLKEIFGIKRFYLEELMEK